MTGELPLPAQLSQALVAFTIEFDNEFERRMPHRTTRHGSTPGMDRPPFLVSMAMWVNCLRFVPEQGIPAAELARRAQVTGPSMAGVLKRMPCVSRPTGLPAPLARIDHRSGPACSPTPTGGAPPSRNRGRCRTTR